ncbi:uncharacterized protein LOC142176160 [Nicotiana tabacum]|uniref:Uncharacterized protein LOC142176160 n=1 Tax=Nicotiana tabacum TaxID=4097 RepID=A0AC58TQ64_TOBAC
MRLALQGESKLGFVDRSGIKSMYRSELAWEKCNAIVLSLIGSTISNELVPSIVYASNEKKVLADFQERFESRPSVELLKNIHLLQFLMGLNKSYGSIRSNVLAKRHVITVNEAYTIVTQEESQRTLGVTDTLKDSLTIMVGKDHELKPKRPRLICDYCGYKGHLNTHRISK